MTTLPGIDVSNYQGASFNWAAYRGRIAFAFIRATEGLNLRDEDFARNWATAASLGIVRGAYHVLHPDLSGAAQADFFLSVVAARPGDLVMVDVEITKTASGAPISPAQVSDCVGAYADIVRAKTGAWPVAYTDQSMAYGGYLASVGQCPAFIANPSQIQLPMPIGPWRLVSFQQTGQRGVDVDEFFGDLPELRRLTVSRPLSPAPAPAPVAAPAPAPARPAVLLGVNASRTYAKGDALDVHWLTSTDGGKTYIPAI